MEVRLGQVRLSASELGRCGENAQGLFLSFLYLDTPQVASQTLFKPFY
jgi:hypothetical protein